MPAPLLKFTDAKGAASILRTGSVYVTSPLNLNDPFESRPNWPPSHEESKHQEECALSEHMATNPPGGVLISPSTPPKMPVQQHFGIADRRNAHVFEHLHQRYRVLCLSADILDLSNDFGKTRPEASLLWAHYADKFKGVALALDSGAFDNGIQSGGFTIEYKEERVALPYVRYSRSLERMPHPSECIDLLTRKSPIWGYEQEIRMIYDLSVFRDSPNHHVHEAIDAVRLPPAAFTAVVFGIDCPPESVREIESLTKSGDFGHLRFFSTAIPSDGYGVQYSEKTAQEILHRQVDRRERMRSIGRLL